MRAGVESGREIGRGAQWLQMPVFPKDCGDIDGTVSLRPRDVGACEWHVQLRTPVRPVRVCQRRGIVRLSEDDVFSGSTGGKDRHESEPGNC